MSANGMFFALRQKTIAAPQFMTLCRFWQKKHKLPDGRLDFVRSEDQRVESRSMDSDYSIENCVIVDGHAVFDATGWSAACIWNGAKQLIGFTLGESTLTREDFLEIFRVVCAQYGVPDYGALFETETGYSPVGYVNGIIHVQANRPRLPVEARRIMLWSNYSEDLLRWRALRDVYPETILGPSFAALNIRDGVDLLEWIEADQNRGTVRPIGHGCFQWTVPAELRESIREELGRAKKLIAFVPAEIASQLK